jgi:hypothetical protein
VQRAGRGKMRHVSKNGDENVDGHTHSPAMMQRASVITQLSCVRVKGLRRGVGSMRSEAVARLPEDAGNAGGPDQGRARLCGTRNPVKALHYTGCVWRPDC